MTIRVVAAEQPGVEDSGRQADPREDQSHLAARDHSHADDRLVPAEPERCVACEEFADDSQDDQDAAGAQGPVARGIERIQGTDLHRGADGHEEDRDEDVAESP